jgi:predicted flavoprotein YhiN
VFEAKASAARKFLMAGKGGLNLTHSEEFSSFVTRYGCRSADLTPWLEKWGASELQAWVKELGFDTFVGTSGRVFPADMKAAPLLRAWLVRMKSQGVQFHMRHRWIGWAEDGKPVLQTESARVKIGCKALVLATGGGSWARLGSDGAWVSLLQDKGWALPRCRRPTAALMWAGRKGVKPAGARSLLSALPGSRSSRWF